MTDQRRRFHRDPGPLGSRISPRPSPSPSPERSAPGPSSRGACARPPRRCGPTASSPATASPCSTSTIPRASSSRWPARRSARQRRRQLPARPARDRLRHQRLEARLLFVGPEFAGAVEKLRDDLPGGRAHDPRRRRRRRVRGVACRARARRRVHPAAPGDCFLQLYTSGTTGFPKGAMLTHRGMLAHSRNVAATPGLRRRTRVQVAMPLFHVGGTSYALMAISLGARRIVMMRTPDPAAALAMIEAERITHTFFVPALLAVMNSVPGAAERDYSSLRALSYGASPMPLPVMRASHEALPGVMQQVYGMTEQSGAVSVLRPADHADPAVAHRLVSAGQPISGVEIEIRDPRHGRAGRHRRARRGLGAQRPAHGRLLGQARGDRRDDHARRLAALRRRRLPRRGRLPLRHRPHQGHDHQRRREHLPRRDRARARRAPAGRRTSP